MAHLAGKSGNVFVANLLIHSCEGAFSNGTHGTASQESTLVKEGVYSAKVVGSGVVAGDIIMYASVEGYPVNFTGYTHAVCWARSSATVAAVDLRLVIDKDAGLPAAPESLLDFPSLTANTWKYCHLTEVVGNEIADSTAGVTVGLEYNANAADTSIYLDSIRAAKNIAGINTWSLDYTTDALETTDFANAGVRSHIIGGSGWAGTFSGYKDGAPLSMGEIYGIELAESATATQMYIGNIIITGVHPSATQEGLVLVTYDFQGTAGLSVSTT